MTRYWRNVCFVWSFTPQLTHISLASYFGDIGKQYRPRWDAAERGVSSGSTLFAYRNFYKQWNKNEKNTPDSAKTESGLVQMIMMGKSIRQMWVNIMPGRPQERWGKKGKTWQTRRMIYETELEDGMALKVCRYLRSTSSFIIWIQGYPKLDPEEVCMPKYRHVLETNASFLTPLSIIFCFNDISNNLQCNAP